MGGSWLAARVAALAPSTRGRAPCTLDAMIRRGLSEFLLHKINQDPITREGIASMVASAPRRFRLDEGWLHAPSRPGNDFSLTLPFTETLENTFEYMTTVDHLPFRQGTGGKPYTYFRGSSENTDIVTPVRDWLAKIGRYVAIRDCLAISFALDFDREDGDPSKPHTRLGNLRTHAKSYDGTITPQTIEAADALVEEIRTFLATVTVYKCADAIAGVPPSDPRKPFDLPGYIARKLGAELQLENVCDSVTTKSLRPQLKNAALDEKLNAIENTIHVDASRVEGKTILLIEDLYQSGVSMNYTAMVLLQAGASRILGLSCVKTCRNSDNITEQSSEP